MNDLRQLIPRNKHDEERVKAIVAAGFPTVEPILPDLLGQWIDGNWPVSYALQPFLLNIGAPLAAHISHLFATSEDHVAKYQILGMLVSESATLRELLRPELERFATSPTPAEHAEEIDRLAREILDEAP